MVLGGRYRGKFVSEYVPGVFGLGHEMDQGCVGGHFNVDEVVDGGEGGAQFVPFGLIGDRVEFAEIDSSGEVGDPAI